jgi:CBS domain-containing protein
MLTDRDIAVRAVARGKGPDTKVREVMTPEVRYCFEDKDLDAVVRNMGENKGTHPAGAALRGRGDLGGSPLRLV